MKKAACVLSASGMFRSWSGLPLRSVTANSRSLSFTCPSPLWSNSAKSWIEFDPTVPEYAEAEPGIHELELAAGTEARAIPAGG